MVRNCLSSVFRRRCTSRRLAHALRCSFILLIAHLGLLGVSAGCKKPVAKTLSMQPEAAAPTGPLVAAPGQTGSCTPAYPYHGTNALYLDTNPPASASSSSSSSSSACAAKSAVLLSGTITDVPAFSESLAVPMLSPNISSREGATISKIVVHHTDGRIGGALSNLRNVASRVSAHLLVARNGDVVRIVSDDLKAWHAVESNRTSLGVEIEAWELGQGLTMPQERMLLSVLSYWSKKYSISIDQIVSHRSVIPTRCPEFIWFKDADLTAWLRKATPFLK
jgi:hypothetical protein